MESGKCSTGEGMVINDKSFFYTLCYPEHFTESFLKLYRFSLQDGDYTILGDSIPIYSDKINTNANLYYDEDLNTLYAVVHEFEDDIKIRFAYLFSRFSSDYGKGACQPSANRKEK